MRWSKVRKLVEESFAESVRGRVTVHVANYPRIRSRHCDCSYGWIAIDGKPFVHTDTHLAYKLVRSNVYLTTDAGYEQSSELPVRLPGDLSDACWEYLHSSVSNSLASPNPLIASLAVLSGRVGKQRLRRMLHAKLHPLTRALLEFRMQAEKAQPLAKAG
jgi:hypothetical protein